MSKIFLNHKLVLPRLTLSTVKSPIGLLASIALLPYILFKHHHDVTPEIADTYLGFK